MHPVTRSHRGREKEVPVPLNQVERLNLKIRYQSLVAEANHEQVMFEGLVHRAQAEFDRRDQQNRNQ